MDPNKLKVGDFITIVTNHDISIGRILSLENYHLSAGHKLNDKVCRANALIFPAWSETSHSNPEYIAEISGYYLEKAERSSEAEVTAWLKAAKEHEDDLRKEIEVIHKCITTPVAIKRITPMSKLKWYEHARLPPEINFAWNWLWGTLQRFKLYNSDKKEVTLWNKKKWKLLPRLP